MDGSTTTEEDLVSSVHNQSATNMDDPGEFALLESSLEPVGRFLAELNKMSTAAYCGYFTVVLAVILFVSQVHYIYQTATRRKLSFGLEFSIVLLIVIAVFDILQIVSHFASGIQMILYSRDSRLAIPRDNWTYVFGALIDSGWNGSCFALCFLTMHRFFWLFSPKCAQYLVSAWVSKIFLFLLLLFVLLDLLYSLVITEAHVIFNPSAMGWVVTPWMSESTPFKRVVVLLNTVTNSAVVYFNLPFLIGISYLMIQRKKEYFNHSDRFILFQMLSFYIYGTMTWILWEFVASNLTSYFWKYVVWILIWMIWNGMKPLSAILQDGIRYIHRYQRPSTEFRVSTVARMSKDISVPLRTVQQVERGKGRTIKSAF